MHIFILNICVNLKNIHAECKHCYVLFKTYISNLKMVLFKLGFSCHFQTVINHITPKIGNKICLLLQTSGRIHASTPAAGSPAPLTLLLSPGCRLGSGQLQALQVPQP